MYIFFGMIKNFEAPAHSASVWAGLFFSRNENFARAHKLRDQQLATKVALSTPLDDPSQRGGGIIDARCRGVDDAVIINCRARVVIDRRAGGDAEGGLREVALSTPSDNLS